MGCWCTSHPKKSSSVQAVLVLAWHFRVMTSPHRKHSSSSSSWPAGWFQWSAAFGTRVIKRTETRHRFELVCRSSHLVLVVAHTRVRAWETSRPSYLQVIYRRFNESGKIARPSTLELELGLALDLLGRPIISRRHRNLLVQINSLAKAPWRRDWRHSGTRAAQDRAVIKQRHEFMLLRFI